MLTVDGVMLCSKLVNEEFFQKTFYNLNMLLGYDLIQTLRNPMESGADRLIRIMPYSITLFFVWVIYNWGLILTGGNQAF